MSQPKDPDDPIITGGLYPASKEIWDPRADPVAKKEKDPFDARPKGEWRSLYPAPLHRVIAQELVYLGLCFALGFLVATIGMAEHYGYGLFAIERLDKTLSRVLADATLAFGAGLVGGTLFSLKWLYHSVAKGMWHLDRRLWRLSTPWISAGLAVAVLALLRSDALRLFNPVIVRSPGGVFGVSFLVGYFSDVTIGKLNELADVLFAPGRGEKGVSRYSITHEQPDSRSLPAADNAELKPTSVGTPAESPQNNSESKNE